MNARQIIDEARWDGDWGIYFDEADSARMAQRFLDVAREEFGNAYVYRNAAPYGTGLIAVATRGVQRALLELARKHGFDAYPNRSEPAEEKERRGAKKALASIGDEIKSTMESRIEEDRSHVVFRERFKVWLDMVRKRNRRVRPFSKHDHAKIASLGDFASELAADVGVPDPEVNTTNINQLQASDKPINIHRLVITARPEKGPQDQYWYCEAHIMAKALTGETKPNFVIAPRVKTDKQSVTAADVQTLHPLYLQMKRVADAAGNSAFTGKPIPIHFSGFSSAERLAVINGTDLRSETLKSPASAYRAAYGGGRDEEYEKTILKDSSMALDYAVHVLKTDWPPVNEIVKSKRFESKVNSVVRRFVTTVGNPRVHYQARDAVNHLDWVLKKYRVLSSDPQATAAIDGHLSLLYKAKQNDTRY
jgi:hypothetical protein